MSTSAQEELDRYLSSGKEHITSHPEDRHDPDNLSSHDDNDDHDESTLHPMSRTTTSQTTSTARTYHIPYKQFDANTGPKGVIADAQSYSRAKQSTFRKAFANITNTFSWKSSGTAGTEAVGEKHPGKSRTSSTDDSDTPEAATEDEDEDEEFMRQWRVKRLAELSSTNGTGHQRRASPSKRRWGSLEAVDANRYLDAIEKVGRDVVVVVCIYDPESPASSRVESALETLAQRHPTTRFVKLHHDVAEMTHVEVPALLAYQGGDVFATLSACHRHLDAAGGLEARMRREGIVS